MNIDKLKARLSALMAKAKDKGASESEALAALDMATQLSAKYGVDLADLDDPDKVEFKRHESESNGGKAWLHEIDSMLGRGIANFCDVKVWTGGKAGDIVYFGIEADVMLAHFIRDRLKATMEYEFGIWKAYEMIGPLVAGMRKSFMRSFASRITQRLQAIKDKTAHYARDTGALTVRKEGLIKVEMERMDVRLRRARSKRQKNNWHNGAANAGTNAGNAADIGQATSSTGNAGLLT